MLCKGYLHIINLLLKEGRKENAPNTLFGIT